ncbi:MAG: class I SAM-dependent methyltransferase [bacterium]
MKINEPTAKTRGYDMHHLVYCAVVALALSFGAGSAYADIEEKLQAAIDSDSRSEAEKARDANRKPLETLKFFGLQEDMRVLELLPGGGWYSKILAPALAEKGQLLVAIGTQNVAAQIEAGTLTDVEVLDVDMSSFSRPQGSRRFALSALTLDTSNIDMVLTFRNLHNLTEETRAILNKEVFRVLKPGGVYGVVDHTRRHMQEDNSENWRRMDPVQAIKEIEAAGFDFVDYADLHYRYDDELVYEVGRRSVTGNTDRFTLLFRKP